MKILTCEGYKMFEGKMKITPKASFVEPFILEGTWLYKPDTECWYCKGRSFGSAICTIIESEVVD